MKLGIGALAFWIVCVTMLFMLDFEAFKLGFFAVILAIAILVAFGIKAFLSDNDDS